MVAKDLYKAPHNDSKAVKKSIYKSINGKFWWYSLHDEAFDDVEREILV
jgi:hypothetical protein